MRISVDYYKDLKASQEKYKQALHALKMIANDSDERHIQEYADQTITTLETPHASPDAR